MSQVWHLEVRGFKNTTVYITMQKENKTWTHLTKHKFLYQMNNWQSLVIDTTNYYYLLTARNCFALVAAETVLRENKKVSTFFLCACAVGFKDELLARWRRRQHAEGLPSPSHPDIPDRLLLKPVTAFKALESCKHPSSTFRPLLRAFVTDSRINVYLPILLSLCCLKM